MGELLKDAATIRQLQTMAGIDPTQEYTKRTASQLARYKLAELVLSTQCQAQGTQDVCTSCHALRLEQPMCQMQNDTIAISNE